MKPILFNTEMVRAILNERKTQTRRVVKENNKVEQITLDRLCCICGFFDEETINYGCTHKECGETGEDINGKEHGRCFSWSCPFGQEWGYEDDCESSFDGDTYMNIPIPSYQIGDILWVRETFSEWLDYDTRSLSRVTYKASDEDCSGKWKPSIHMPKEYARIFLKVTEVRVERLQDISDKDCLAEGIYEVDDNDCTGNYKVYTIGKPNIQNGIILSDKYNSAYEAFEILWDSVAKEGYKFKDNPYVFVYEFERIEKPC